MTPKLRTIRTTRYVGSVSRKQIATAVKAVAAVRNPEMGRLVRGEAPKEEIARLAGK